MAHILIIEDDSRVANLMAATIQQIEHTAVIADNIQNGLTQLQSVDFDIVLLDVNLPDGNGLEILPEIRNTASLPEVIIITGDCTLEGAEKAIQHGAWDYLSKPLQPPNLILTLNRVLLYRTEKAKAAPPLILKREGIIGNSAKLKTSFEMAARAATTSGNVLITGETGTGKELFAKAIHDNSKRAGKPFVIVDCGALPETLVESILFGHEKGAFTHAVVAREGLAKQADGGTLFLDEIGELPMAVQSAFLRLLQEHRYRPVGGAGEVKTDFRLIAATNRNLQQMVTENTFRKDLYFRIQSMIINLPPLRERIDDIEELSNFYITKFCDNYGIAVKTVSKEFLEALKTYLWPGNIRELANVLERSIPMTNEEKTMFPVHLPPNIRLFLAKSEFEEKQTDTSAPQAPLCFGSDYPNLKTLIKKTEKAYFQQVVSNTDGDIEKICSISGLSRANVYNRLKKYDIRRNY